MRVMAVSFTSAMRWSSTMDNEVIAKCNVIIVIELGCQSRSLSIMVRALAFKSDHVLTDPGSNPHQVNFFIYLNRD